MEYSLCLSCTRISPSRGEPLTGEPDAGDPHVRFGGRGNHSFSLPLLDGGQAANALAMVTPHSNHSELVRVRGLVKHFPVEGSDDVVRAIDGVSFEILRGETLGLVGESGCGKSTAGRCLLRLVEPTKGRIIFDGRDVLSMGKRELRELRRALQIVFRDPYASLNPRMKVGDIVGEPLVIHMIGTKKERRERVAGLLSRVGLDPDYMDRYPHEFSGGQRQRIGVARTLALNPKL